MIHIRCKKWCKPNYRCNVKESVHPEFGIARPAGGKDNRPQVGLKSERGIRSWDRHITGIRELPGARRLLGSPRPSHGQTGCADRKVGYSVRKTGVGNLPPLRSGKSCRQLRSTGWVFGSVGHHRMLTAPPVRDSFKWE